MRRATCQLSYKGWVVKISIHALREESDPLTSPMTPATFPFQSTLSVRRATRTARTPAPMRRFQSTLSVRRATYRDGLTTLQLIISIHALREESDIGSLDRGSKRLFQSTLSVRRATFVGFSVIEHRLISIHALREESDWPLWRRS